MKHGFVKGKGIELRIPIGKDNPMDKAGRDNKSITQMGGHKCVIGPVLDLSAIHIADLIEGMGMGGFADVASADTVHMVLSFRWLLEIIQRNLIDHKYRTFPW